MMKKMMSPLFGSIINCNANMLWYINFKFSAFKIGKPEENAAITMLRDIILRKTLGKSR